MIDIEASSVHNYFMRSRLSRLITSIAIIVCLPLQGLAAVAMPACQTHGQNAGMYVNADHGDEGMSHCDQHNNNQPSRNSKCDKCLNCYLSASQAIVPFNLTIEVNGAAPMVFGLSKEIPDSDPYLLLRPPQLTFA